MTPRSYALAFAALPLLVLAFDASAADHLDSPLVRGDPAADINDVYAFVNPNDAGELVVVATVSPLANRNTRFSDAVEYRFHFDNGASGGSALITCVFEDESTTVSCNGAGLSASGNIERVLEGSGLRVFAGLRDDPFFFDLAAFNQTRDTLTPAFTDPGSDFFAGLDSLAIVLGIQHAALTGEGLNPVLKVYASTRRFGDVTAASGTPQFEASEDNIISYDVEGVTTQ